MRVSLSIDCNGAAFYVADPSYELVRIFRHLADRIERAPTAEQLDGVAIADANGNTVGRLSVKLAECPYCGRECEPGDAKCRDSDCARHDAPPDTVAVIVARADADTLADALARAAERDNHLANECENAEDQETAAEVRECVSALDRLAAAIAAAVRQEGPAV